MGGLCAGGVPGVPSAPEIDIDMEEIANLTAESIKGIAEKTEENIQQFPKEITNADPQPFCVPDTNIELTKDSTDADICLAAITAAFATQARDAIKDMIWGQIEPKVDEQLDKVEGLPQKIKDKAKDTAKEKTVDVAVDKALDEALEKMKADKNN
eukprot:423233_1